MSITSFKQKWPSLIRRAEKDLKLKFRKKPSLKFRRSTPKVGARSRMKYRGRNRNDVAIVTETEICLSRRMARDHPKLAEAMSLHELREGLLSQHGYSKQKAHALAMKYEKRDAKRLSLRTLGWELRTYYGQKRQRKPKNLFC